MPPRKPGETAESSGVEVLLQVTVSREHYERLRVMAAERGSSVAVLSKAVFAKAMSDTPDTISEEV